MTIFHTVRHSEAQCGKFPHIASISSKIEKSTEFFIVKLFLCGNFRQVRQFSALCRTVPHCAALCHTVRTFFSIFWQKENFPVIPQKRGCPKCRNFLYVLCHTVPHFSSIFWKKNIFLWSLRRKLVIRKSEILKFLFPAQHYQPNSRKYHWK